MAKYIGWIPSVIGNLSYSLAGHSNYPETANLCIFEYNNSFHYIISQKRVSHDFQLGLATLIPFKKYAKKFEAFILERRGLYSTWIPVLIGTCSYKSSNPIPDNIVGKNFQMLEGQVFFLPRTPETKKLLNVLKKSIADIDDCLSNKQSDFCPEEAYKVKLNLEIFLNDVTKLENRKFSLFTCDFELQRNGICSLSGLDKIIHKTNISSQFDNQEPLTDEQAYNQIFYFLKDIFHSHKFHSPDYDTLTQVYKFDESNPQGWAIETLKNFYRSAIRFSPEDSMGIIYYARAFKDIIKTNKKHENDDGFSFLDKNSVSDTHAESVCKARIDSRKRVMDAKKWISGLFGGGLLLTWSRIHTEILALAEITNKTDVLVIHFIIPFSIAWGVLIYAEKGRNFSVSISSQLIKLIKYLSSIPSFLQLITLLTILLLGISLWYVTFFL